MPQPGDHSSMDEDAVRRIIGGVDHQLAGEFGQGGLQRSGFQGDPIADVQAIGGVRCGTEQRELLRISGGGIVPLRGKRSAFEHLLEQRLGVRVELEADAEGDAVEREEVLRHGCTGGPSRGVWMGLARPTN